jgi:phage terminase Nu1 subunit (DNA packaging protein)
MSTNFAGIVLNLEELHAAILQNLGLVPGVEKLHEPLEAAIENIRNLSIARNTLIADKQRVTQELKAAVAEGTTLAINIRAIVRGEVGARSEKLVEFGIAPLRRRTRKPKPPEEPETKQ